MSHEMTCSSFPLRPILLKSLLIQSNQTGTKEDMLDMLATLELSAIGKICPKFEVLKLQDLNECLDRVKRGEVRGKLV